jgi:hypothetical protein
MTTKDFKYFAKFDKLIENAKKIDKCRKKHCKDLIQAAENERKENAKYIMDYYEKSKAHKEFIKKQNEYTDIKEQNRLNKLNLNQYHKTTEYKEFNKKTNSFINSKIKQQLDQCPDLYKQRH